MAQHARRLQLVVTFFRVATNTHGDSYKSPIHAYYFDADTLETDAISDAKAKFVAKYEKDALEELAHHFHEVSLDFKP